MAKVPARRVPSDDFVVAVDGTDYHTHEGEWVEIRSSMKVGAMKSIARFMEIASEFDAVDGDDAGAELVQLMSTYFDDITGALEMRITNWNWTDDDGEPLATPGTPGWVEAVSIEELMYLVGVMSGGENPEQAKNA